MTRYSRQTVLSEIGEEGQNKLKKSSVLCIGAGGLGSPILLYLVAAGVGHIGIVEFDVVDISNLQRQILFNTQDIGKPKAHCAKNHLHLLNPDVQIEIFPEGLNEQNAEHLFRQYDIILDGTDNFETKYLINDTAHKCAKPWIFGAIQGFDGQVSVFDTHTGPCYRCLYPAPPKTPIQNCAEFGVIGAVAGLIGITQAMQALQLIIKHTSFEPLIGKLWTIDTRTMHTHVYSIQKRADCSVCSKEAHHITLNYASPVCGIIHELTPEQISMRQPNAILIDVREQEEWDEGHIEDAILIPLSELRAGKIPALDTNIEIILYCQRGIRSKQAAAILRGEGYLNTYSMSGGYEEWLNIF